ncbi:MAG: phosphoglycerate kinase [Planctomycetota bacterium]
MNKLTLQDVGVKGKRVLMRVDYNVPIDDKGTILDDIRIKASLPSIKYILDNGGKVVLMSHLGRPEGQKDDKLKMEPIAARLEKLLGRPVKQLPDCIGSEVEKAVSKLKDGECVLLENLRFYPGEEANDDDFSRKLAYLGNVYVNDAFSVSHRSHASVVGVTRYLRGIAGLQMKKEIEYLSRLLKDPEQPFWAVFGGAKVSDKITIIQNLFAAVKGMIVGGAMAYTFMRAKGLATGNSKVEADKVELAKTILAQAEAQKIEIVLPVDHLVADKVEAKARIRIEAGEIPEGWAGVDIGPKSIQLFAEKLSKAKTVIWNGPMGIFEIDKFAAGTQRVAQTLANLKATTVIGGGETAAAASKFGLTEKMTHVSTGGGASLEFLEGKELPGVQVLANR